VKVGDTVCRLDANGEYVLVGVAPGPVELSLLINRKSPPGCEPVRVLAAPGETVRHDFDLHRSTVPLGGRVIGADGTPLASVRVAASGPSRFEIVAATDEGGAFHLDMPDSAGDVCHVRVGGRLGAIEVDLQAGTTDAVVPMPSAAEWVHVVDADTGLAIPVCNLIHVEPGRESRDFGGDSSPDGLFRVAGLRSGEGLVVSAPDLGYASSLVGAASLGGTTADAPLRVALRRGVKVTLRWRGDPASLPDVERRLAAFATDEQLENWIVGSACTQPIMREGARVALTDSQVIGVGEPEVWVVRGLAPGRYRLRASPDDVLFDPPEFVVRSDPEQEFVVQFAPR
jgi:hypothetical protein